MNEDPNSAKQPWWECEDKGEMGIEMAKTAVAIDALPQESERADLLIQYLRQFESTSMTSLYQYGGKFFGGGGQSDTTFNLGDISTWNVARSVIMTAVALIGKSRPRARFITNGGDYRARKNAKTATKFCDGWAAESKLYQTTYECLIDSMVSDVGAVQLIDQGTKGGKPGKIYPQRILASELRVDPIDALYGTPRTMYRRRLVGKDVLLTRYGSKMTDKARAAVQLAAPVDPSGLGLDAELAGMIQCHEAWHLASVPGGKDGKHALAIEGAEILSGDFDKQTFTIKLLKWEEARAGFWGRSLMSQLSPMQTQLNVLLSRTDKAQHLMAIPRIAIKKGSKISKAQLSNLVGSIVEYTTEAPQPLVWPAMPPEIYQFIENIIEKMYDLTGVSRDMASGEADSKAESGVAKRESLDVQQGRLQPHMQSWEQFHVEIFEEAVEMMAEIHEKGGDYKVSAPGKNSLDHVSYSEWKMDRDDYTIAVWPTSQLPITPQGRLDFAEDMLKAGLWEPDRAKQVFEDLDIENADNLELGAARWLNQQFEAALYDAKPCHPDEITPFAQALKSCAQFISLGRSEACPPKNIDLLLRYLEELKALQPKPPAPPAPPPLAQGLPIPAPAPLPLSPLPATGL